MPPARENEVTVSVDNEVINTTETQTQTIYKSKGRRGGWGKSLRERNAKKLVRKVRVVRQEEQEHQVEEIRYVSHLPSTKVVHF